MQMRIISIIVVAVLFVLGFFGACQASGLDSGMGLFCLLIAGRAISDIVLWLKNPELFWLHGRIGEGTKG
jgi:hypothetical protein